MIISQLFATEKNPKRGLMAMEWVMIAYMAFTTLFILFASTKLAHPETLLLGRAKVLAITLALWLVYRMAPCRFTKLCRVVGQLVLLSWWYPDTYELNRILPNLDHIFAQWEQNVFGGQPSLWFSQALSHPIFSELMDMGYASYYPMIVAVCLFYFFARYTEFERCSTIVLSAFFIYYIMYILVPVVGPTFYFNAIGLDQASNAIFPAVGDYFNTHTDCLVSPGYSDGLFYYFVESAKAAGERPTAAFPSSHVGIATLCMLLALHTKEKKLVWILTPFYILLCFATVYIQAHYAIDAIAGLVSGILLYAILLLLTKGLKQ